MKIKITLTEIGADHTGSFTLYSDTDNFMYPFRALVSRNDLLAGFTTTSAPEGTSIVRLFSEGPCKNYLDINLEEVPNNVTTTTITTTIPFP